MSEKYNNNFLNSQNYIFGNIEKQRLLSKLFIEISLNNFLNLSTKISRILSPRILVVIIYLIIITYINYILNSDPYLRSSGDSNSLLIITFIFVLFFLVSFTVKVDYKLSNLKKYFFSESNNVFLIFFKGFILFYLFIKYIDYFFWNSPLYTPIYIIVSQIVFIPIYIYILYLFLYKCNVTNVFFSFLIAPYILLKGILLYLYIKILGITKYYLFIKKTPFKNLKQIFNSIDYNFAENDKYFIKIKNKNSNFKFNFKNPNINNSLLKISNIFIKTSLVLNIISLPFGLFILGLNHWNFNESNNFHFFILLIIFLSLGIIGEIIYEILKKKIDSRIIFSIGSFIIIIYLYILYIIYGR